MFSDENGFKNALIGNYIMLKDGKLYGKTLTMEFVRICSALEDRSAGDRWVYRRL